MVTSPLEFMPLLAALMRRPRLHLIRLHGLLAPNAKLRAQVVPQEFELPAQRAPPAAVELGKEASASWWRTTGDERRLVAARDDGLG